MTSPASAKHLRAFTLVELLVVIGIMALLISITVPMVLRARAAAAKAQANSDLIAISQGLEAYKTDFQDYPRTNYPDALPPAYDAGATVLAAALAGPGPATGVGVGADGLDGAGFRIRVGGQKYGPYIQTDRIKVIAVGTGLWALSDRDGFPIQYYAARPGGYNAATMGVMGITRMSTQYMWYDGSLTPFSHDPSNQQFLRALLGDTNADGLINGTETLRYSGPYVLWSAGSDTKFGYPTMDATTLSNAALKAAYLEKMISKSDDAYNFTR